MKLDEIFRSTAVTPWIALKMIEASGFIISESDSDLMFSLTKIRLEATQNIIIACAPSSQQK